MPAEDFSKLLVDQAGKYWTLANALTAFYFAQALAFWYKLSEKELASKLRPIAPWILAILWVQAVFVVVLVYGNYRAELTLLVEAGSKTDSIKWTSMWACYARILIVTAITGFSTLFVLLTTGRLQRTTQPSTLPDDAGSGVGA